MTDQEQRAVDDIRQLLERAAADGTPDYPLDIRPLQRRAGRNRVARATIAVTLVTGLAWGVAQATLRRPDVALVEPGRSDATEVETTAASEAGKDVRRQIEIRRWRDDLCVGLVDAGEACGFGVPRQHALSVVRERDATGDYVYGIAAPEVETVQIKRPGQEATTAMTTEVRLRRAFAGVKYFAWKFRPGTGTDTTVEALDANGDVVATDEPPPLPDR